MKRELQLFGKDLPDAVRLEYENVMLQLSELQANVLKYEERTPADILTMPQLQEGAIIYIELAKKPVEASITKVYCNYLKIPGHYGYKVSRNGASVKLTETELRQRMESAQRLLRHEA